MRFFENRPIREKLMMGMLVTSSVVLFVACAIYFIYEYVSFKTALVEQTAILGEMCAANSTAALMFGDAGDAQSVLSALSADPNIVSAILVNDLDTILATYPEGLSVSPDSIPNFQAGFHFNSSRLEGFVPVIHDGEEIGALYITAKMDAIYDRLQLYSVIALGVIVLSLFVSYLLSVTIQRNISRSILSLVRAADIVSNEKNYSIRAQKYDNDEIGTLTNTFNNMLHEIEKQNDQITAFNQDLEAKVKQRTQELETAYEEMESFSYTVSHDLNAPLRKIDTFIDSFLGRNDTVDEESRKIFEKITTNTTRMRTLISDLLTFSQLGKKELVRMVVDMKAMVATIIEDLTKSEEGRKIEFRLCNLPTAFVDEMTINQVWVNLISNALKYSKTREQSTVEVCFREESDAVVYYVRDNGVGFDMKYYDKLFSPFQRLHSQKDFEGTGVGLAIVYRIVTKHGGSIWAESAADQGATFYFSVPKQDPQFAPGVA
ncbi:MAG: ATP-binding protein [Bacteroidota bacterium]|nr:ATP-binding protein [Bacteroidota bacterium]